ncbi:MAG: DedA family protein [Paludibacteraceae bacterium]|nr:DedA family protein [Paludibacteraceae bacterium]
MEGLEFLETFGIVGLFIASFLAATVLPFSSEVVFAGVLATGCNPLGCLISAAIGNTLGGLTCYWIGRMGKTEWIEKYLKIKYEKIKKMERWAHDKGSILAALTFLPGIGDVIAVALGYLRCNVWLVALFMFIGKTLRYIIWMKAQFALFN